MQLREQALFLQTGEQQGDTIDHIIRAQVRYQEAASPCAPVLTQEVMDHQKSAVPSQCW